MRLSKQSGDAAEPVGLYAFTATLADLAPYLEWSPDRHGSGFGFVEDAARAAAIGEAFERYSGNYVPELELTRSSFEALRHAGVAAIDPRSSWAFVADQGLLVHERFSAPDAGDPIEWTTMIDSRSGENVAVPAALVYLNYYRSRPDERREHPVMLPGIAAGTTVSAAASAASLEILERDATTLWWIGGAPAVRLVLPDVLTELIQSTDPNRFQYDAYLLRSFGPQSDVHVVAFILTDLQDASLQIGFACRQSIDAAVLKAAAEAWQLRRLNQAIADCGSWIWKQGPDGRRPMPLLPDDEIEKARGSCNEAPISRLTQLVHNLQYFTSLERQHEALVAVADRTSGSLHTDELQNSTSSTPVAEVLAHEGLDSYWKDLTTDDVHDIGLAVVRVFSPQACPNLPTAFPPLGNQRLARSIEMHRSGKPYLQPMPHA